MEKFALMHINNYVILNLINKRREHMNVGISVRDYLFEKMKRAFACSICGTQTALQMLSMGLLS